MVKNLPAVWKMWVQFVGQEKEMATLSSILAWEIPWTKEPGELQSMGLQRIGHDCATNTFTFFKITIIKLLSYYCAICCTDHLDHL